MFSLQKRDGNYVTMEVLTNATVVTVWQYVSVT